MQRVEKKNIPGGWYFLDTEPRILSDFLLELGVEGVQIEEIWSFKRSFPEVTKPAHGIIIFFKWFYVDEDSRVADKTAKHVFHGRLVINNSCPTLALVNVLLNIDTQDQTEVYIGRNMDELKKASSNMDANMKGLFLSNHNVLRCLHNKYALRLHPGQEKQRHSDNNAQHFLIYLPVGEKVYEMDGMRKYPRCLGNVEGHRDWVDVAIPTMRKKIQRFKKEEVSFQVLAVTNKCDTSAEQRITIREHHPFSDLDHFQFLETAEEYENKKKNYRFAEATRRNFNYTPFIVEWVKTLEENGKLAEAYYRAKSRVVKGPTGPREEPLITEDTPVDFE